MKITLPENISEITLGQYQEYEKLMKREDLNDQDKVYRMVKTFTGLSFKDVSAIKYSDLIEMVDIIKKALETECEFEKTFFINKIEFGFIPNLDDIKAKEYFDLSEYNDEIENLHKLMAILYRPISKKDMLGNYSIVEYQGTKEWAEVMRRTPLNVVNGALGFFLNLSKELQSYILRYSSQVQAKVTQQQTTLKSGVGMQPLMN